MWGIPSGVKHDRHRPAPLSSSCANVEGGNRMDIEIDFASGAGSAVRT
jgi:hypothetical protein